MKKHKSSSPTKAKVSLVVSDFSSGGAIRAFLLGQVLKQLEYEVETVGFQFGEQLYAYPPENIPIFSVPGDIYPQVWQSTRQLLAKIDGDIIYAVKPKPTSFGVSLLQKLMKRRPVILDMDDWELSWYGGDEWRYQPPSLKQFYRDLFKPNGALREPDHPLYVQWTEKLVRYADAVTIDTEFLQQRFGGTYLPNGKDTNLFNPHLYDAQASREKYQLQGYRILMFPGAPRAHKGVEDILMALEQLNQPDLRLVIVGGSPYDDYDEQLQERWGQWIIQLPRCPVEKMPEIIAAAHVVVVPQRDTLTAMAQFPLKLTDGMAMAKPTISTRVGDIPEILGETGFLVEPNNPQQLAQTIEEIFNNWELAHSRGEQARARCVNNYSVATMAQTLSQVLANI